MRAAVVCTLTLCFGFLAGSSEAKTWLVDPTGTGDAPTIQAAIDLSTSGDIIQLAPGSYTWANQGSGDAFGMIRMKSGISLAGDVAYPQSVVLDAQSAGRVVYASAATGCTYSGLTITGGSKTFGPEYGGGLACGASSRLLSCRFVGNSATRGGGAYLNGSDVEIDDCLFSGNGCSIEGGAIYGSPSSLRRTTFENNSTASTSGGVFSPSGIALVEACVFNNNGNQALMVMGGALNLSQCEFRGSSGQYGVWMYAVTANISQSLFAGLYQAIHMEGEAVFRVSGCTIVGSAGSALRLRYGWLLMEHCIIASGGEYFISNSQLPSDPQFSCCDVYGNDNGGPDGGWFGYWAKFDGVNGNFSADPLFCDGADADYSLQSVSPCLPGQHGGVSCGLIGAFDIGCGPTVLVRPVSWGGVKGLYR